MFKEEIAVLFEKLMGRAPTEWEISQFADLSREIAERKLQSWKNSKSCGLGFSAAEEENLQEASPKVAVLLSGHFRKGNIVPTLKKIGNFDVFAFVWDDFGFKGKETNLSLSEPAAVESSLCTVPNLRSYRIAKNKNFIESIREETEKKRYFNFSSDEVFIKSQLYAIKKSHELMQDYSRRNGVVYDVVLKIRFDCSIRSFAIDKKTMDYVSERGAVFVTNEGCHRHPHVQNGCMICNKMYDIDLHMPHIGDHSNIICDFMAYGNPQAMSQYCAMYDVYDEINERFSIINSKVLSERNLSFAFRGNNMKVGLIDGIFYFYCSYPERIIQHYLSDRMLISSRSILVDFHRR